MEGLVNQGAPQAVGENQPAAEEIATLRKRFEEAVESFDCAIAIKRDYIEAHTNRGNALKELHRLEAAVMSYDHAISIDPECAEAHSNRGVALKELRQIDAALASYARAIAIKPDYADAYFNRGSALMELRQLDAAIASYDSAIAIKPDYADAHWNKSLTLLLDGDFSNGLPLYEWRWNRETFTSPKRDFLQPLWLGQEALGGKTVLLHSEQGLGDTLQFCRYASLVANLGARVILEVEKPLAELLRNVAGASELVLKGSELPAFDFHCPLLSLPLAFKTDLGSIPASTNYLSADPTKTAQWAVRLGNKTRPRVGLVWSGSTTHTNDRNRSILLADWLHQLPSGYQYVSLQKEVRDIDEIAISSQTDLLHFEDEINNFTDTAALCSLMDLVVSVDTSVAHLSGALGKPTWVLLPFTPDWRWLLDRDDSPWYPSMKLYRQATAGDWDGVLTKMKSDLLTLDHAAQIQKYS